MPDFPRCAPGGVGDRSGGGFEGDLVAEGFEVADVFPLAAFGAEPVSVEVRAEVVEVGVRVGEQVPDDGQDRAADRDEGFLGSAAAGQASVAFAEEGLGAAGADRGLAEDAGQVAVAMPGAAGALLLARRFLDPWGQVSRRFLDPWGQARTPTISPCSATAAATTSKPYGKRS